MSGSKQTVHIKWVRSGIGLPMRQKEMVRSLGLGRLNQVVERPDTAQINGLISRIPHLVEIVKPAKPAAWRSVAEYTVSQPKESVRAKAEAPAPTAEQAAPEAVASVEASAPEKQAKAPKKKAAAKGSPTGSARETKKSPPKPAKKAAHGKAAEAAASKSSKTTKKEKK